MKNNSTSNNIPPLIKHDQDGNTEFAFTDTEKANILNKYFSTISDLDDSHSELPNFAERTNDVLENFIISRDEVFDIIKTLQHNKATGPDGLSHRLLRGVSSSISLPLSILFNMSLSMKCYPSIWKEANVVPLFKKNDRNLPSNYRPISLLSCVGKIMERVIFKYLYNFLNERDLINKYQSGFQPGHSTVFQLIEIYDRICKSLDNKEYTCIAFCDISKAFDRVWHRGLLHKLKSYGIKNNMLAWFKNYLSDRKQCVVLNSTKSEYLSVKAGVPQGSVLGPLLFLIYINDISDSFSSLTRLFADDSSLSSSSRDLSVIEREINNDLTKLAEWAKSWLVLFNPNKTEIVLFTNRFFSNYPQIEFENQPVKFVGHHKHLGLTLSSDGKWENYIDDIITRCSKMLWVLRKLKMILSRKCLNSMYLSFIRPILEYADVVWDGCSEIQSKKLECIQTEAARIVTGLTRSTKLENLYSEIGWIPLSERRKEHKLVTLFKIINGLAPSYLTELLPSMVGHNLQYNLRDNMNFCEPFCRLEISKHSFFPSSIALWNRLPNHIKEISSLSSFKRNIVRKPSPVPKHFIIGERKYSVIHSRLRNKCSNLNNDLYMNHLSPSPNCFCSQQEETACHYFFHCNNYAIERQDMLDKLNQLSLPTDLDSLLYGNAPLSDDQNCELFKIVQDYIKSTKRFK